MAIRCYLAMTAGEFSAAERLPAHLGWMACHFSCYGTGLSNLPAALPPGSLVTINDRTPVHGHDPVRLTEQLTELTERLKVSCFLLDFQRPGSAETARIVRALTEGLPCPVGVSEVYARESDCAVFLPPCPLRVTLDAHLAPWKGRAIWLDAALEAETVTVDKKGSRFEGASPEALPEPVFMDEALCCRYHTEVQQDRVIFHLLRDREMLAALLEKAEQLGVTQAVGLYQQLGNTQK